MPNLWSFLCQHHGVFFSAERGWGSPHKPTVSYLFNQMICQHFGPTSHWYYSWETTTVTIPKRLDTHEYLKESGDLWDVLTSSARKAFQNLNPQAPPPNKGPKSANAHAHTHSKRVYYIYTHTTPLKTYRRHINNTCCYCMKCHIHFWWWLPHSCRLTQVKPRTEQPKACRPRWAAAGASPPTPDGASAACETECATMGTGHQIRRTVVKHGNMRGT